MRKISILPRETRVWLWIWLGCNCYALLNVLWGYFTNKVLNGWGYGWGFAWSNEFIRWNLLALLIPPIIRFSNRHPYNHKTPLRCALKFFLGGLKYSFIHNICFSILYCAVHINRPEMPFTLGTILNEFMGFFWASFIAYVAILAFTQAFEYYDNFQESQLNYQESLLRASRLETQLAQAQLETLKAQLQPHFIFNALNSISALQLRDVRAAQKMIANLGQFLRLTLARTKSQEVMLEHEIEFLRFYLDIEQVRFQDRLTINFDIEPETLYARVPNLILQPIVENAIKHGVAQQTAAVNITISAKRAADRLILQVEDNGPGIHDIEELWSAARVGIGLDNTRARLEYLYGREQFLRLTNRPTGGLVVTISFLFQYFSDATMEVVSLD